MIRSILPVVLISAIVLMESTLALRNKFITSNVSNILDLLLKNDRYDKRLRPGFGGPPITISVNFFIKSLGPVSDKDESYGLDCYFRQHWYDKRLKFDKLPGLEELSMSWLFLDRVWKPDTYFINGKRSFLHKITVPNKFLRLRHDGYITYSMRLTVKASCPMYLRRFPLDAQKCPLIVGSYGYSNQDLIYKWTKEAAIGLQKGVEIAQFDLVNITTEEEKTTMRGGLPYSVVRADFWLKRHTGYFMLQVYAPCGLIVLSSWVSFWIDPDDVPARVALGVTTVLSLTTMGFGGRSQMPKVSYCTALDYFVIICFVYVFSVMIEYAVVNMNDKFKKDFKKMMEIQNMTEKFKKNESKTEEDEEEINTLKDAEKPVFRIRSSTFPIGGSSLSEGKLKELPESFRPQTSMLQHFNSSDLYVYLRTIIAHLISSEDRCQSLPNLPTYDEKDSLSEPFQNFEKNFSRVEEVSDVILNVGSQLSIANDKHITSDKCPKVFLLTCLKRFKATFGFWNKKTQFYSEDELNSLLLDSPDKFSKLDVLSRINFPVTFFISLIFYLLAFTYYYSDDNPNTLSV